MTSRFVSGLSAVALAALWSFSTLSIVSAATTPPDEADADAAAADTEEPSEADESEVDAAAADTEEPSEADEPEADAAAAADADVDVDDAEEPSEADEPADSSDQEGHVVDEMQGTVASSSSRTDLHIPVEGIRPSTDVVGEVVGHPTGKILLADHDVVTLRFRRSEDVKPHSLYAIAREEQFVEHPDSGRNMGYVVRVVATVEMEKAFGRYWSGRIVSSTDYVTTDDWVIPFEPAQEVTGEGAPALAGHVVAVRDALVLAGAATVVYTDLGSDHGVKTGDEFSVIRPETGGRRGGPDRPVGVLRILAVQPSSSSAYLTATTEPVMIGDRLERVLTSSAVQ